jgi:hypothetical protein
MFPASYKTADNAGITGHYNNNPLAIKVITAFFAGLAMYNAVELMAAVFITFQRYHGLYFWSLLVASFGIIPYSLAGVIKFFELVEQASSDSYRTVWRKSSDVGEMDDYHRCHRVSHPYRRTECWLQRHMGSQCRPIPSGL